MDRREALGQLGTLALAAVAAEVGAVGKPGSDVDLTMDNQHTRKLWDQCLEQLRENGSFIDTSLVEADSPDMAREAVSYLFMSLASAYILMARSDPENPEFLPWVNHVLDYAAPNPDATYYFARISSEGVYRVFGYRNSVHWVDFLTGYDFVGFTDKPGKAFASEQIDNFTISDDGSFELYLSNTRPAGYRGNWMKLEPRVNYLVIRQFAYGPDEVDARMGIERLDKTSAPQIHNSEKTAGLINDIIRYVKTSSSAWPGFARWLEEYPVNTFHIFPLKGVGEVEGQSYYESLYEIAEDQALLIEFTMPKQCFYWNIQIADRFWRTLEYMNRHTSFNGHVERTDNDGKVRIVIAHRDPGVANWVDACGVTEGHLLIRFQQADSRPGPATKLLPYDEVDKHLPPETRRVSREERAQQLRKWRMARQLRRSW